LSFQERAELGLRKKSISITDYLNSGLYIIMRKCPTIHLMLGCETVWDLSSTQFKWVLENLSEEFKKTK